MPIVRRLLAVACAAPMILTACGGREGRHQSANVKLRSRDSTRPLGPGDVQIENSDNSIELAVNGDSVVTGFGATVLDEIRSKTDTADVKGSGFGASIEKMVKSTVAGAMSHQLVFPIRDISDVKYEDGRLLFYNRDGSRMHLFENTKVNGKDASMTFRREDAERFIAAFRARKAAMGSS